MTLIKRVQTVKTAVVFIKEAHREGDTKGCTYYTAHNQANPNDSQTHVLYLNTFQVELGEKTARASSSET